MPDAEVLNMAMELRLEFMAVVRPDLADAERELFDNVVREVDCIGLGMFLIDL